MCEKCAQKRAINACLMINYENALMHYNTSDLIAIIVSELECVCAPQKCQVIAWNVRKCG